MMLTRLIRNQLRVFAVISVFALAWVGVVYAELPSRLGFGHYQVDVEFADASGLYPRANVTYRGNKVGKVSDVVLTREGVRAQLEIDDDIRIPGDVRAELRSTSAIGEQYVDLVPNSGRGRLDDGSTIPVEQTVEMPQIAPVLDEITDLMESVPGASTRRLLDQVDAGLNGTGEDLGGLLDEADLLLDEAQRNVDATTDLIRGAEPVLATQQDLAGDTRAWIDSMARVTEQLEAEDDQVDALLDEGRSSLLASADLLADIDPTLPSLLHNTRAVAQPLRIYQDHLETILATYPAMLARLKTTVIGRDRFSDVRLDIKTNLGSPDSCVNGYIPIRSRRNPADLTPTSAPSGGYCEEVTAGDVAVRGVRNVPCPGGSRRAATPAECGIELITAVPAAGETTYTSYVPRSAVTGRYRDEAGRQHRLDRVPSGLAKGDQGWKTLLTAPVG